MNHYHQNYGRRRNLTRVASLAAAICLLHQDSVMNFVSSANAQEGTTSQLNLTMADIEAEYEILSEKQYITESSNYRKLEDVEDPAEAPATEGTTEETTE